MTNVCLPPAGRCIQFPLVGGMFSYGHSYAKLHNNSMKGSSCLGVQFGAVLQDVLGWAGLRCAAWCSGTRVLRL